MKTYAGIGSREITPDERNLIAQISEYLGVKGYIVFSGNADGSDITFQENCGGQTVVLLPWNKHNLKGFNYKTDALDWFVTASSPEAQASLELHPAPHVLKQAVQKLFIRSYYCITGYDKYPASQFAICCGHPTGNPENPIHGGTGQTIRVAMSAGIPWYNIREYMNFEHFKSWFILANKPLVQTI